MSRLTPLSNISSKKTPRGCRFDAPARKSIRTEDGWIDVPWSPEELKEYRHTVLDQPRITPSTLQP